jgi:hypothetical protein
LTRIIQYLVSTKFVVIPHLQLALRRIEKAFGVEEAPLPDSSKNKPVPNGKIPGLKMNGYKPAFQTNGHT